MASLDGLDGQQPESFRIPDICIALYFNSIVHVS